MKLTLALFCLIVFLCVPETSAGFIKPKKILGTLGKVVSAGTKIVSGFFGGFGGNGGGDGGDDCDEDCDEKKRFARAPENFYNQDRVTSKQMHAKCRHNNFEVQLGVVEAHLVLIFVPQSNELGPNCTNHFLFHSWADSAVGQMGIFQEFTPFVVQSKNLATFKLGEVHGSHLGRRIFSQAFPDHTAYDTIDSNCAHKIIYLLQKLDLPITYGVANFVVENIIKSAKFMEGLRAHPGLPKVFPSATTSELQQMDDRTLADGLVHYTLANEYHVVHSDSYKIATIVLATLLGCVAAILLVGLVAYTLRTTNKLEKC